MEADFMVLRPLSPLWNTLTLDRRNSISLQEQIVAHFRDAVLSGRLLSGSRVPSSRALATEQGIARITVVQAYDRLVAEGYLVPSRGSGFFVADGIPVEFLAKTPLATGKARDTRVPPLKPVEWTRTIPDRPHSPLALSLGMPAVEQFPWADWSRITQKVYRERRQEMLCYGDPCGAPELRTAIARYLGTARGIACSPSQIVIVGGSQQGIDLSARALIDRGERIWMEEPGYQMARAAFQAALIKTVPVPVDQEGIDVAAGILLARRARLALVSPSYQYPLGVTLSLPRRLALLEWAESTNAWILEDDYAGEFRYAGAPLPPLYTLDRSSRVLYLGTFSKSLAPGLRQGFLVVPSDLVERFRALKLISDRQTPVLDQHILARFISEGYLAAHLRRMRQLYSRRRKALLEALSNDAAGVLYVNNTPEVGLHIVARTYVPVDDFIVSRSLLKRQIYAAPLSSFYASASDERGFALGFAGTCESQIEPAVRHLVREVESILHQGKRTVASKGLKRLHSQQFVLGR
jgi:GntR family transcriptional regulator/MocR family aminotransferase